MSFPHLTASLPTPVSSLRHGDQFARELTDLVDEIQRTRDWFNAQIEAQLSSLNQLRSTMQIDEPAVSTSMATLFEAPHPVVEPVVAEPAVEPPPPNGVRQPHQAIVLPPTHITTIDPELEQATLRELNDALSRAFSEISTRGGMLG
jgi:hypothetical protein